MNQTQSTPGQKLKQAINGTTQDAVYDAIQQYKSTLNVAPDHLEGLLYTALNGVDMSTYQRLLVPTLAKLFELLTDKTVKPYLGYVLDNEDIDIAGYLLRRFIAFFHQALNDEYLVATVKAYAVKHHFEEYFEGDPAWLEDIHKEFLQKIAAK